MIFTVTSIYSQDLSYDYNPQPILFENDDYHLLSEQLEKESLIWARENYKDRDVREHVQNAISNRHKSFEKMLESGELIVTGELHAHVQSIMDKISAAGGNTEKVRVLLVRDESPNAFNAGDDFVFIHLGLIVRLHSNDEIAMVLAHELAHNNQNHFINRVEAYAALVENDSINRRIREIKRSDYGRVSALNELMIPWILSSKSISRTCEFEADSIGFDWCTKAGYNPDKAAGIFDVLGYSEFERDTSIYNLSELIYLNELDGNYNEALEASYGSSLGVFEVEKDTLEELLRTHPYSADRKVAFIQKMTVDTMQNEVDPSFLQVRYWAEVDLLASLMYTDDIDRAILYSLSAIRTDSSHSMAKRVLPLSFSYLGYSKEKRHMGKLVRVHSNNYDDVYNELIYFLRKISPKQCYEISEILSDKFGYNELSPEMNAVNAINELRESNNEDFDLRNNIEQNKQEYFYSAKILKSVVNQ